MCIYLFYLCIVYPLSLPVAFWNIGMVMTFKKVIYPNRRLKVAEGQSKEHEAQKMELQCNLEIANTQLDVLNKVTIMYSQLRVA